MVVEKSVWIIAIIFINISRCGKHYIVPSSGVNTLCSTTASCLTLHQFAIESGNSVDNQIQLTLLPGNHSLDANIFFSNTDNVSLMSISENPLTVSINCGLVGTIALSRVKSVHVSGIRFVDCIDMITDQVNSFILNDCIFTTSSISEEMLSTGLIVTETNLYICKTSFMFFHGVQWKLHERIDIRQYARSGGAIVISSQSNVTIVGCVFKENTATIGGAIFMEYSSYIDIKNSSFSHNMVNCSDGGYGGVLFANNGSRVFVTSSKFERNMVVPQNSGNEGGVFALFGSNAEVYDSVFVRNLAAFGGGVLTCKANSVNIVRSIFFDTDATRGGAVYTQQCEVHIINSSFHQNTAFLGGAIYVMISSILIISNSQFTVNSVKAPGGSGGVIFSTDSLILISDDSFFFNNTAYINGGVVDAIETELLITGCTFSHNSAVVGVGGCYKMNDGSAVHIVRSLYLGNRAGRDGGAVYVHSSTVTIEESKFNQNRAKNNGGAVSMSDCKTHFSGTIVFNSNTAHSGGAVYNAYGSLQINGSLSINNSRACVGVVYLAHCSTVLLGSVSSDGNTGSIFAFDSQVNISGNVMSTKNNESSILESVNCSSGLNFQEGGALTAVLSRIEIRGNVRFERNNSTRGGGILAVASRLYFSATLKVRRNTAKHTGGGFYLYQCQLHISGKLCLDKNTANTMGGGIHSISTSIVFFGTEKPGTIKQSQSKFVISSNRARMGGGLAVEYGSKVYVIADYKILVFNKNKATKGGAIYVADNTNSGACPSDTHNITDLAIECFFQWISPSIKIRKQKIKLNQVLTFTNNYAKASGGTLHGGLLDRCTISPFHKHYQRLFNGPTNMNTSVFSFTENGAIHSLKEISSEPVRICFCKHNKPDCSFHPSIVRVKRGEKFTIKLVSVDHVNHTVNATIYTSLSSGTLGEDQQVQSSSLHCTAIEYNVFSPLHQVKLQIYSEGPCNNTGISLRHLEVVFLPCSCAVGFQPSDKKQSECECTCDSDLYPYITDCNATTSSITRTANFWITSFELNTSNKPGYLLYPNCPFDYCHLPSKTITVNLNEPDGADTQCAFNRSGLLCSTCQPGLSLSLGSSRCVFCPSYWPALFTVTLLGISVAGIVLVAFILVLNLTVATGAMNGLILYANIVAANRGVFVPFTTTNFHSVFIDWVNLELGFDTCLFDGMDAYIKIWLQIGFSFYLITIVIMIIFISERSSRFARLIGRGNPVATLSTVILLSYTKLLHNIITILSFAILTYPDGRQEVIWLPDATVYYLKGKHIPLFMACLCILGLVVAYTFLLFSWQWLLRLQNKKCFKWTSNTRFASFMDAYHAPYTFGNRYWTGLLLLLRVCLYLVASMNASGEPSINILAVSLSMSSLLLLVSFLKKPIYKNALINGLELACYFHIVVLAVVKYHILKTRRGDYALAYTSISISFVMFLSVVGYSFAKVSNILKLVRRIKKDTQNNLQAPLLETIEVTPKVTCSEVTIEDNTETNPPPALPLHTGGMVIFN